MIDWISGFLDRLDERRACRARSSMGRSGRLLSWSRADPGAWTARLSGPGWPSTIERRGRSRRAAILRASDAFEARVGLALRGRAQAEGAAPPRTANDIEGYSWP